MPFSEALKTTVRRRAHFQCCVCRALGVEVHHIVPQENKGSDDEDNAAPLCPSCHETYGANPTKRKFIREARDLWYEICQDRYASDFQALGEIRRALDDVASRTDFRQFKEEVLAAVGQSRAPHSLQVGSPIVGTERDDLVRLLSMDDVLAILYSRTSTRPRSQWGLLVLEDLWPEKDGIRSTFISFKQHFGERAAALVAGAALDEMGVGVGKGLTELEIGAGFSLMLTTVSLYELMWAGKAEAAMKHDGSIVWRALKAKPMPRKKSAKRKRN